MKNLSEAFISGAQINNTDVPDARCFSLPERVLQFGTGVLLRGLPDYFIDKANKQGVFNGRVVVVKSTSQGGLEGFALQDCLFTHFIRGINNGKDVDERIINASVSRVLNASDEWQSVLQVAEDPVVDIVISNTTEVGITLVNENILDKAPASFPGKLLAVLYHRYLFFKGDISKGMVIVPTELIPENGALLKSVCMELAAFNNLDERFISWLDSCNYFCDSLVDRIVPGKLTIDQKAWLNEEACYTDQLAILSEPYALWAIKAVHPEVNRRLSFSTVDAGVILAPGINKYRQLKLHLLNGTHTFCCGLAILCGFNTVKETLADQSFSTYINRLLNNEMIPALVDENISTEEAEQFAFNVVERFRNPAIDHFWQSITLNFSSKMKMRNLPLLMSYAQGNEKAPNFMSLGFAAMLVYLHHNVEKNGKYFYKHDNREIEIQDDKVPVFNSCWVENDPLASTQKLLAESSVWGMDLNQLQGFTISVAEYVEQLLTRNPLQVLADALEALKPENI